MSGTRLHAYWRSSASWRVRIGLNIKGVAYDIRPVHLAKDGGEQHGETYRRLNPAELVPTLEIDGHVLSESLAILRYLDDTRPEPPLLPSDPYLAAKAWQLAELINAGIQPLQNLRTQQRLSAQFGVETEERVAWTRHWISLGFEALEKEQYGRARLLYTRLLSEFPDHLQALPAHHNLALACEKDLQLDIAVG